MFLIKRFKDFLRCFRPKKKSFLQSIQSNLPPLSPILSTRSPNFKDKAEIGQCWINETKASIYIYSGQKTFWKEIKPYNKGE